MAIQRHGNWEYTTISNKSLKRRIGAVDWTEMSPPPSPTHPDFSNATTLLHLVREMQALGEPDHWLLFLAQENKAGAIFEVRGDAVAMHYNHQDDVNPLLEDVFKDSFVLAEWSNEAGAHDGAASGQIREEDGGKASLSSAEEENCKAENNSGSVRDRTDTGKSGVVSGGMPERVRFWAYHETSPMAKNQKEVKENCQGWCVRVVERLVHEGYVESKWLESMRGMMQAVK